MPGPSTGRPGSGWIRADPDRRGRARPDRPQHAASRRSRGLVAGAFAAMNPELFASLRSAWEAVNNRWNQWVLNYTRGQQLDVLKNLGFAAPDWQDLALLLIGMLEHAGARRRRLGLARPAPRSTRGCASSSA